MRAEYASLCVLSFNRLAFMADTIEELHAKSQHPFELIVHDDGSTPAVQTVLMEYMLEGKISSLILNPAGHNQGQGTALNRMFNMATGDPIVKLDQDMVYEDGWLRDAVGIMEAEHEIGLLGLFKYPLDPVDYRKTILHDYGTWERHTHICGSGFAVRRDCWDLLGPFEEHYESFGEDWQFQKKVTESTAWCCALPPSDLVENRGFGVGPSTVVINHNHDVQPIHKEPVIYGREDG